MTQQLMDQVRQELATMFGEIVQEIEAKPLTTKDHYGDYMAAIATLAGPDSRKRMVATGVALVLAGANKDGVRSALEAMGAFQ